MVNRRPITFCSVIIMILLSSSVPLSAQAPALPDEDSSIYYGYYWGAAGIATGLLKLAKSGLFEDSLAVEVESVATNALDIVWLNRYEFENGTKIPAWTKYVDGDIYPGLKYGATGIVKMYLEAYDLTDNTVYLTRAIESIDELFLEETVNSTYPNWPYAYVGVRNTDGIPLTDLSFGSLGVLETTLKLYKITNDVSYINKSVEVFKWLDNVSRVYISNSKPVKLLPWYSYEESYGSLYSSYYSGNAAAIPLFLELGRITNDQTIIDWANNILGVFLETQNSDGSWPIILNKQESLSRTTLELGSAGILYSFAQLNNDEHTGNLTQSMEKGADWLVSLINRTNGQFFIPLDPIMSNGKFGILNGLTGILKSIRLTNLTKFNLVLEEGYNHLINNILYINTVDGVEIAGMFPSSFHETYTDLSYMDGLMGLALELFDLLSSNFNFINEETIQNMLLLILQTYLKFQNSDGVWQKQITLPDVPIITSINDKSSNTDGETKDNDEDENSLWWVWFLLGIPLILTVFMNKYISNRK
ncbi:MAG: lanthionine synthetase LanC family protein [Candidatus Kariarchaeaceae archaeon]